MKTTKQDKGTIKLLGKILTITIILLLALISFVGIYVTDKNSMKNIIPEYQLGMELNGARNIVIKADNGTVTKRYDSEGKLVTDDSEEENITEVQEPVNALELLTTENYKAVKETIEARLKYMQVEGYLLRFDESTGNISLEVPENSSTDYIAQYTVTKGEFKIVDADTLEVLLTNADLKETKIQYGATEKGTTVYLNIEFNKNGAEKLKEISNTYVASKDSEGNDTTKKVKMMLDDETIISTYFQEEITDGIIQLSMGTSTNPSELQSYLQQASNIAIFLNTNPMPITYKMEINRFVYSDITTNTLKLAILVLVVVAIIMAVFMIVKYKKNGVMGVLANIGFVAILLLALRYGNVLISLAGIIIIAVVAIIEYIITMLILKEYSKKNNAEITKKNIKQLLGKVALTLTPLAIMSVTFSVMKWEEIASVGMVLFWSVLILTIYNILILVVRLFNSSNGAKEVNKTKIETKKEEKKENNSKTKSKKDNAKKTTKKENK